MPRPLARPARGVSLVELLVGMIIALMVLGIALQLMLIARARYYRLADEALIKDRGMQALELIGSAVHHAGWITDTPASSSARRWPDSGAPPSLSLGLVLGARSPELVGNFVRNLRENRVRLVIGIADAV